MGEKLQSFLMRKFCIEKFILPINIQTKNFGRLRIFEVQFPYVLISFKSKNDSSKHESLGMLIIPVACKPRLCQEVGGSSFSLKLLCAKNIHEPRPNVILEFQDPATFKKWH